MNRFLYILLMLVPFLFHGLSIERPLTELPSVPVARFSSISVSDLDTVLVPDGAFVAQAEGCTDTFIVPPPPSGPTISCGIDLHAIGTKNAVRIFTGLVSDSVLGIIRSASIHHGPSAKVWVRSHQLKLDSNVTQRAFQRALALMWADVGGPALNSQPAVVKEALLSYLYHTGHLPAPVRKLKSMSPRSVAALLRSKGGVYVGSNTKAFRRRRSQEAKYIEQCCSDALVVCRATNSLSSS